VTGPLTGYEKESVDEVGAILDVMPADADEVYLRTIGLSERAIAAVAAKRAGSGGGGISIAYESFSGDYVPVLDDDGPTAIPWTTSNGPDVLLDISNVTQPNVLEDGVYAIMADTIQNDAITVGGYYIATLTLQGPSGSGQVTSQSPPSTALGSSGQYPQASTMVMIRYLTVSDNINLKVELQDGLTDNSFSQSGSIVQRIS
jgi:hypothetical protein